MRGTSARYRRAMSNQSDDQNIGDLLLATLADFVKITQALPAPNAASVLDETEVEVFWRDWPEVRSWAESVWQRLGRDLAGPAQPVSDPELDEVGEGD
jgi:hypothetical protein